jgi:exodeoxyribonuclease (lambda-induced)
MGRLIDVQQGTPEWHLCRMGIPTGSGMAAVLTGERGNKDAFGATALNYALELAAERMGVSEDGPNTFEMQRGSMLEEHALDAYEEHEFVLVRRGLFFMHDTLDVGASPDGIVELPNGKIRGIEVKCRNTVEHMRYWLDQAPKPSDMVQMQCGMWVTGADEWDFVAYHPGVPDGRDLCIIRVQRDDQFIAAMSMRTVRFLKIVEEYAEKFGVTGWKPYALHLSQTSAEIAAEGR